MRKSLLSGCLAAGLLFSTAGIAAEKSSDPYVQQQKHKQKKRSIERIGGGAAGGALIGALAGGGKGAAVGGLVGGGAGYVYNKHKQKKERLQQ